MSERDKPMLSASKQVERLYNKGVKFNIISDEDAIAYLSENNNYFKLGAFRKNYQKYSKGANADKYINLEFAYLKDLSTIDMRLRYLLLHMALDVEHFAKVKLLRAIEKHSEDGYSIVEDFRNNLPEMRYNALDNEIDRNSKSPYCGAVINKYSTGGFPVWAFIEIISFGSFISFYKFCAEKFNNKDMVDDYYLMLSIKALRNAAAHNNCLINDLEPRSSYKTQYFIMQELNKIGIGKKTRKRKMGNIRIQQIVTLLFTHKKIVTSPGVHNYQSKVLHKLVSERMFRNIEYYKDNDTIKATFNFLKIVIDNWFSVQYTDNT